MKSFVDHLVESEKRYEFKIRVAGELPEGFEDRLENNLKKYDLISLSQGKKTPIQETPMHFPNLQNMEVTHFDAAVRYPTVAEHLKKYLADYCSVNEKFIQVTSANSPLESGIDTNENEVYEPKLTKQEMEQADPDAQKQVGGNRVMELIKELEQARAEREVDPSKGGPQGDSQDISPETNTKPVVGG